MADSFNIIEEKLNRFIKKYQIFMLIKGVFFAISIFILLIVTESVIEFFSYLSIYTRTILFYTTLLFLIFIFIYFFILPTFVLFNLKKGIDYKDANNLINNYFPEIKDKLLNTIELYKNEQNSSVKSDLLIASIEQKTAEIEPFDFSLCVNFIIDIFIYSKRFISRYWTIN